MEGKLLIIFIYTSLEDGNNMEVRKRENESAGSLMRRFAKMGQASGFLAHARETRYRKRAKSAYTVRKEALRRIKWEREMQKKRKLGKID